MNDPFNGIESPSHPLVAPDCDTHEPRPCIQCGKIHDTGMQDMITGKMLSRFDKCRDCLFEDWFIQLNAVPIDVIFEETDFAKNK